MNIDKVIGWIAGALAFISVALLIGGYLEPSMTREPKRPAPEKIVHHFDVVRFHVPPYKGDVGDGYR